MKPTEKEEAATSKLTLQQAEILFTVEDNDYTASELNELFEYFNKTDLPDYIRGFDTLIDAYLSSAQEIKAEEITGLCYLFRLTRTLEGFAHK